MENFCDRLKTVMEIRQMTQADIVRATGLNKGGISNYVNGLYKPKVDVMKKLATALNCSEAWLHGYDVPMERDRVTQIAGVKKVGASLLIKITPQDGESLSHVQVGDVLIFGKVKHVQEVIEDEGGKP